MAEPPHNPWKDAKFYRRERGRRATLGDRIFMIVVGAAVGAALFAGTTFWLVGVDSHRYREFHERDRTYTTTEYRERGFFKLLWGLGILGAIVGGVTVAGFLVESDKTDEGG